MTIPGSLVCYFAMLVFVRFRCLGIIPESATWTPKVCKIMAFMAVIMGLGLLFYLLLGFR